ncbi:hypothetical protein HII12_004914 [Brettanomyces bruxellensis]|uniref:Genetic interactor of prohibitin 7, mitochondrial n=1 Tax=Dekkera bruxellensis TaxID=5007 RepID=A0A8H6B7K7_DEKBR|nr:hypothetical protein HII12_004914 [Brettanomyces bruxellensis]
MAIIGVILLPKPNRLVGSTNRISTFIRLMSTEPNKGKYGVPTADQIRAAVEKKRDAQKRKKILLNMSIRDVLSSFTGEGDLEEEDFDLKKFDPAPYYANPAAFKKLPYYHRHFMGEQVKELQKRSWKLLSIDQKRFCYWLAYGSFGPREGFPNMYDYYSVSGKGGLNEIAPSDGLAGLDNEKNKEISQNMPPKAQQADELTEIIQQVGENTGKPEQERQAFVLQHSGDKIKKRDTVLARNARKLDPADMMNRKAGIPPDLPFRYPSVLKTARPTAETPIRRLPELDARSFGFKRLKQYQQDRRMNPYNRILIAVLTILTVLAFRHDRKVNLTGSVPVNGWEEEQRQIKEYEEQTAAKKENERLSKLLDESLEVSQSKETGSGRKWYYLWLA